MNSTLTRQRSPRTRAWLVCGLALLLAVASVAADAGIKIERFEEIENKTLSLLVVGSDNCSPTFDAASIYFEQVLDDDLIADMLAALDNAGSVTVKYTTDGDSTIVGDGAARLDAKIHTAITRTPAIRLLDTQSEAETAPPGFGFKTDYEVSLTHDDIELWQAGDVLIVWATGSGGVWSVGCEVSDQALLHYKFANGGNPLIFIEGIP